MKKALFHIRRKMCIIDWYQILIQISIIDEKSLRTIDATFFSIDTEYKIFAVSGSAILEMRFICFLFFHLFFTRVFFLLRKKSLCHN